MSPERAARYFWLLVTAHVVVWTLARLLAEPNAPLDLVEMAYLGHEWQLGYPNHPPLAAWVTEATVVLGGGSLWAVYLASQLAMVTCLWAAWRLGRELLSPGAALLGAAVLECCLYYHFTTSHVNNNVALYPFWALAVLFFHRALTASAPRDWLATGACVGIGFLAKYSMAVLVVAMVAFMLVVPAARRHWRRPGPYLALGVALVIVAPHLYWAAREHFPAVQWAIERTRDPDQRPRAINVLAFARDQLPAVLPIVAVLLPLTGLRWRLRRLDPVERFSRAFLVAMALGPFAIQVVLALALDLRLRSMYGSQLWTFTGVLILFSLALRPETVRWRTAATGCGLLAVGMVAAAIVYDQAWPYVNGQPMSVHFPGRETAARVHAVWRERFDQPLLVVGGEWMLAANAALYSRPRLQVYSGGPYARHPDPSPRDNPWTSDEALKRTGGILLWSADRQEPSIAARLCRRFPTLELLDPVALRWETGAAIAPLRVAMAVIPPKSDEAASARRRSAPAIAGCPRGPEERERGAPLKRRGILSAAVNADTEEQPRMDKPAIGFIGLGRMGGPMARNLARAGYTVSVFDVDAAAAAKAVSVPGTTRHDSPGDVAASSAVLFTALPNDEIVRGTYLGPKGVVERGTPGLVTCDCSTVSPEVSQAISDAARHKGIFHMDTPMLGSSPQAESGEIFFMVGGDRDTLPAIQPMLDVMGRLTMYVGPSGTGNRIKLLHNALGAVNAAAVAESLALCVTLGVDPKTYYDVVKNGGGMAYSTYFDRRAMRVIEGNFDPTFTLELMLKDVTLASQMAGSQLEHMPILRDTLAAFTEGKRAGWGSEDFSGVTHVIEDRFGRKISAG